MRQGLLSSTCKDTEEPSQFHRSLWDRKPVLAPASQFDHSAHSGFLFSLPQVLILKTLISIAPQIPSWNLLSGKPKDTFILQAFLALQFNGKKYCTRVKQNDIQLTRFTVYRNYLNILILSFFISKMGIIISTHRCFWEGVNKVTYVRGTEHVNKKDKHSINTILPTFSSTIRYLIYMLCVR